MGQAGSSRLGDGGVFILDDPFYLHGRGVGSPKDELAGPSPPPFNPSSRIPTSALAIVDRGPQVRQFKQVGQGRQLSPAPKPVQLGAQL